MVAKYYSVQQLKFSFMKQLGAWDGCRSVTTDQIQMVGVLCPDGLLYDLVCDTIIFKYLKNGLETLIQFRKAL